MAISHLLQLKSASHINRIGILRARILSSSLPSDGNSEKKPHPKKSELAKQQKAQAVESFVKKYMKENHGLFPKQIHVQNEVGGSWYNLKGMLQNIKGRMMENFDERNSSDVSTSASDPEVSSDIPLHKVDDNSGDEPQIHEQAVQAGTTAISDNDKHANQAMPSLDGQSSSPEVVSATALDTLKVNSNSSGFEGALKVQKSNSLKLSKIVPGLVNIFRNTKTAGKESNQETASEEILSGSISMPSETKKELQDLAVDTLKVNSNSSGVEGALKVQNSNSLKHPKILPGLVNIFQNTKTAGKESNQEISSEEILSGIISMHSETTKELQDLVVDKSGYVGYMKLPPEDNPFSLRTYTETKMDKPSLLSDNAYEMIQLKPHPVNGTKDQASEGIANTISDAYIPSFQQQSSEPSRDTDGVSSALEGLIECVKALPQQSVGRPEEIIICNKSDHSSGRAAITGTQQSGNMQKFEKKERFLSSMFDQGGLSLVNMPKSDKKAGSTSIVEKNGIGGPFKKIPGYLNIEDQETSCSAALHCNKSNAQTEVLSLRDNGNLNKALNKTSFRKESDQNKVIVRFVPEMAGREDIIDAFKDYGDISKVKISSTEGASFKAAYVYFRSHEGMKEALERTDVKVRYYTVTVEAASSSKDVTRTCIPDSIGLPDVPTALVKNPKQTVLIMNLAHDISSHHIEDALSFCKSKISQIFLGSLNTVAYVEFETEEGKENALTRHSINILGRRLLIFRVDVPRTTVVRISNLFSIPRNKAVALCKSFGKLRDVLHRGENVVDVHFKLAEWPNMATILNRLNGSEIDGHRLIAQPASVYPPDILEALWSQPKGRQHLRSTAHNLLKKLRENDPSESGTAEQINSLFED